MNSLSEFEIKAIEHDFLGIGGGKGKARRQERRDNRQADKMEKEAAKTERTRIRNAGGGFLSKVSGAVSGVMTSIGMGGNQTDPNLSVNFSSEEEELARLEAERKAQTQKTIIMVVVGLLVVAVILFVVTRKPKKAA